MPPDDPTLQSDPILAGLVGDYLDAVSALDKYGTLKTQLAEQILAKLKPGQRFEVQPGVGVRAQAPARRFDEAKAREMLTPAEYQAICASKPSLQLATRVLPGALLDLCKVPGTKPVLMVLS